MNQENSFQNPIADKLIESLKTDKNKFVKDIESEKATMASVIRNSEAIREALLSNGEYFKNALDKIDNDRIEEQLETIPSTVDVVNDNVDTVQTKCFTGYVEKKEKKVGFFDKLLQII